MKISTYEVPESSFLSVDKDMAIIINKIFENNNLKKLLYYTRPDCLVNKTQCPNLTEEQTLGLFGKEIRIIPKLIIDNSVKNYIIIDFDHFTTNETNPQFRNNSISFDIVCHYDQWHLQDYQLRPLRIAAELDSMFNKKKFSGIGTLEFITGNKFPVSDEFMGFTMMYAAIHGDEDKKWPLTPIEE